MDSKFIARYRRAIHEVEAGNASLELANKLERLGYKLTSSLERDFEESPGSETPYTLLKKALRECLQIEESARIKTRAYLDALAPDLHNAECDIVRAVYGTLEDVIGNLLLLLLTHWQEAELPEKYKFLIEWNRSKPMMELVKEFGRFTVPYELMRSRLNAAKSAAPQPAATMPTELENSKQSRIVPTPKTVVARAEAAMPPADNDKPTHRRLVLLCLYRGQTISKLNCERIAKELNSSKPNAPGVLLKRWKEWGNFEAIRNTAIGARTVNPLIKDMEWVITRLTGEQKKVADNYLRNLK